MARIEKTITIDRPPDDVWSVVSDFGAISSWFPAIAASSFADGIRECTLEGGGTLREEIVDRDDAGRRYTYRITASSLPLDHHHASMTVHGEGSGSLVTWVTEVRPDELAEAMAPVFEDGMKGLKARLEAT